MAKIESLIEIHLTVEQSRKAENELAHIKNGAPRAVSAALNKTATGAKTDIARVVAKKYFATQAAVKATMRTKPASPGRLYASILSTSYVIPLFGYRVSPKKAPSGKRRIKVKVLRGGAGSVLDAVTFVAQMPEGHIGVFERQPVGARAYRIRSTTRNQKTKHGALIRELYGPAISSMIDKSMNIIEPLVAARLEKNINHEIERIEKGYGA